MARGINKVILIGNLGAEPEVRCMPNGQAVANVRLATSDSWRDKETDENHDRTEWHRVVFFARLAEDRQGIPAQGLAGVCRRPDPDPKVAGPRRPRRAIPTEIVANDMQMLGGRGGATAPMEHEPPAHGEAQAPSPASVSSGSGSGAPADLDDDIPF